MKTRFDLKLEFYSDYFHIDKGYHKVTYSPKYSFIYYNVLKSSKDYPTYEFTIPTEAINDYNWNINDNVNRVEDMFRQLDAIIRDRKLGDILC